MTTAEAKQEAPTAEMWAVVELKGHVRLGGRVSEVEMFGSKMGRIDVPLGGDGFTTQFFHGSSVYRIQPVDEAAARAVASYARPAPVHTWEMPRQQLAAAPGSGYGAGAIDGLDAEPDDGGDDPIGRFEGEGGRSRY